MVRMAEKAKTKEKEGEQPSDVSHQKSDESQKTFFPQPPEPMPTYGCPMPPEEKERLKAKVESQKTKDESQESKAESQKIKAFPYPAKNPSGCRFPGEPDITNFQEYGEEPIEMHKDDFIEWWFFCEDPDKPCWSYVGTDKFNHCLLQRRYRHGTPDHYTNEGRFFLIKRNIMASAFALALMQDHMERKHYFEVMERFDKQFPKTGNPEIDGPEILLPPQELLDTPSKEEIERAEQEKERKELSGKVVYQDNKRKLYFAENGMTPMVDYEGKTYTLTCHPYEPMLIIKQNGTDVAYVHNAFYPDDEYKGLVKGQLVHTITGRYHNAERFARIITTALDTSCDRIDEVEDLMFEDLVFDKGADAIEYATYDFRCDRVLYEGVPLLLGHFICYKDRRSETIKNADEVQDLFVYALCFGYPNPHGDMYEYFLITPKEYEEYKKWPEHKEWQTHEAAYEWHEANLKGKQVLCNEFSHMPKTYKPFFRISELPKDYWKVNLVPPFFFIQYERDSVCAQDDYLNHEITIELPENATVKDLVDYIAHHQDDNGYATLPYTGGNTLWTIESNGGTLAELYDDGERIRYFGADTPLRTLQLSSVYGHRKQ